MAKLLSSGDIQGIYGVIKMMQEFYNGDCMEGMKKYPDKYFDIAIVDPPYGIGDKFKGGNSGRMNFNEIVNKKWDKVPDEEYFDQLYRVSKNQIVWGGNYFNLPPTRCFIVWDKLIGEDFSLAMAELAWSNFDKLTKIVRMPTPKDGNKIHSTQKPIALYKWIIKNYVKPGWKILDTHVGSASSLIAYEEFGLEYVGFELDPDYYKLAQERIKNYRDQLKLFEPGF